MSSPPPPILMGVVNVTPDSFSDGNQFFDPAAAIAHARQLAADGAAIIDLGAEASSFFRPGIAPVPAHEQLRRLWPVVDQIHDLGLLSLDTRSAQVAAAILEVHDGVIINDISAGTYDPAMLPTVAGGGGALILMHMSPTYPDSPPENDPDIVATVRFYLQGRLTVARAAGIDEDRLFIDPGLGFGKTLADNWTLLLRAHEFASLGCPIVLGASRKRFLQTIGDQPQLAPILQALAHLAPLARHERDLASAAVTVYAAQHGVQIHRVHNVALAAAALKVFA